jgi:hypothetical protein
MAVLDCGRKAVTVTALGGFFEGTWSGAYSRAKAMDLLTGAGWREAPGEDWEVSPADNGFKLKVIFDPAVTAVRRGLS